ncbi:MAG: DUF6198 family protein [Eubacterium sp.]
MSKGKIRASRELAFVLGMVLMPFAVSLCQKADLGMSMIAAPTYIISQRVSFLSYGQTEYIFQAVVLAIMCIVVKKFKLIYLTSFISAVVYGTILDGFIFLIKADQPAELMWQRIVLFAAGVFLTSLAVALLMHTYLPPCAYDYLVRMVVEVRGFDLRKTKLINDFTYLALGTALTLILFHGFKGVTLATLVIAVVNGNLISFLSSGIDKHFEFFDRFPKLANIF